MARRPHISVINSSTVIEDREVSAMIAAVQFQIDQDFQPSWGMGAFLEQVPKGSPSPNGRWWLVIADSSDQAGALGYHDLTDEGLPVGYVFAKTDQEDGALVSVTFSHEVLEMIADPRINAVFQVSRSELYACEVCDPCEADEYAYEPLVGMPPVSDFLLPNWYCPGLPGPFDFRSKIPAALGIIPGGYMSVLEIGKGGWKQITTSRPARGMRRMDPAPLARRERRRRLRDPEVVVHDVRSKGISYPG